ncbi:MAG: cytochrome c [Planctomycetes bacterium]|nr:cytochrome c [Planctomycetota bacterium]NUQ34753.1 cytochrome c [Planctomycetaceae bacterium]
MKPLSIAFACAITSVAFLGLAACGGEEEKPKGPAPGTLKARANIDAAFKGKTSPFAGDAAKLAAAAEAGKKLFEDPIKCVNCHGPMGKGDGLGGKTYDPLPADLTDPTFHDAVGDDYIFWRITVGGVPAGSAMTAFPQYTDEEKWQLVAYVRTLKGK